MFHHHDALEGRPVVDITMDRVYVLSFMSCIIYIKKFQREVFRFYDLPLYPKKVLMIRNTCCRLKNRQSLCFKFYLAVLMILRTAVVDITIDRDYVLCFMFYVLYHIHRDILEGGA